MKPTLILVAILVTLSSHYHVNGQGDELKKQVKNLADCPNIVAKCTSYVSDTEKTKNEANTDVAKRCCGVHGWANCVKRVIANQCPEDRFENYAATRKDLESPACRNYSFWTPECMWINFTLEVIGIAVAAVVIVIVAIVICCCCCCRGKK